MRLIDADALVNVVKTARNKARTLTGMDFVMATEKQPTIAAIPVWWLEQIKRECAADVQQVPMFVAIGWLVDMWQKEQEAR